VAIASESKKRYRTSSSYQAYKKPDEERSLNGIPYLKNRQKLKRQGVDGFPLDNLPVLQNFETLLWINVDKTDHFV
jgi:hypothetical protein